MKKFVIYYRVSTKEQGKSGLGLQAQRTAVENYLKSEKGIEVPPAFTEIESGKKNNRPELRKAVNQCKETGATLLIAKIDRLARNVQFIFQLKEELEAAKVGFIALDLPEANTLTLGIMASMAQHESERISQRIKSAMAEGKKRGKKYGTQANLTEAAKTKGKETIKRNAMENQAWRHAWHFIKPLREQGISYKKIAEMLNDEGYQTRAGKHFEAMTVYNVYKRFGTPEPEPKKANVKNVKTRK